MTEVNPFSHAAPCPLETSSVCLEVNRAAEKESVTLSACLRLTSAKKAVAVITVVTVPQALPEPRRLAQLLPVELQQGLVPSPRSGQGEVPGSETRGHDPPGTE